MNKDLLSHISVLFVNDEQTTVQSVENFFTPVCKKLITASSVEEAIEIYNNHGDFDIIITDLMLSSKK